MVRNGKFRRTLNLINQLPRASRFLAAVVNDEEHVEALLKMREGQPHDPHEETGPSMSEWTLTAEKASETNDLLAQLIAVTVAAAGGKPRAAKPSARPVTAFAAARDKQLVQKHRSVLGKVAAARQRRATTSPVD